MATNTPSDEKALKLKLTKNVKSRSSTVSQLTCIIHYESNNSEKNVRPLTDHSFDMIHEKKLIRQKSDKPNERLEAICDNIPKTFLEHLHGTHNWCYKNFTNVSRILKRKCTADENEATTSRSKSGRTMKKVQAPTPLFPSTVCLMCNRYRKKVKGRIEIPIKCQTKTAEDTIRATAERLKDFKMLGQITDYDLQAREARYHPTCRKHYTRLHERNYKAMKSPKVKQEQEAHNAAFDFICQHVDENIIKGANVERLSMLKEKYLVFLQEHFPEFYNPQYKTYKLKDKLLKKFGNKLQFWQPNYKSELVYSSNVHQGQAIEVAFEVAASDSKRIEEAALILRRAILDGQRGSPEMPWPPTKEFLLEENIKVPKLLQDFLSLIVGGSKAAETTEIPVRSISQDLCKAATKGKWMMPKHLLLGMTLRHLTGSAEIVTILHRFGHCASYSCLLELETAMCDSITETERILPRGIQVEDNRVTHLCWDNFDLTEETSTGAGTTHTAHGIVIQELSFSENDNMSEVGEKSSNPRTKKRSISYIPKEIEPCFLKPKAEPVFAPSLLTSPNKDVNDVAKSSDSLWLLSRAMTKESFQTVPNWAGWISLTGRVKEYGEAQSRVQYMPPINAPVTENATVQHILKLSQLASREVNQQYTIVTFDLAVAKKAYAIVWQDPNAFGDVIVRLGVFHTTCAFLGVIGKRMRASGFEEILIESGICASGSINKVISGKHYNRAMRVHKTMLEALERLLLQSFESNVTTLWKGRARDIMERLAHSPSRELLDEALANEDCTAMIQQYNIFKEEIRRGEHGKTAKFWIDYMDKVLLVLRFQRATKESNFDLHISCLEQLCPMFFCYDHPNYARYTTIYMLSMLNLDKSHPGAKELLHHGMSVSRSDVRCSRNAVDITIEQTINRHAKSSGGIIGFSRNCAAYTRWCLTRHARAGYVQATMQMVEMDSNVSASHNDLKKSEIMYSEERVRKVIDAIENFINPFNVEDQSLLYCLSSGSPAPKDVEEDLLEAETYGKKSFDEFIQERLINKTKSFNDPIKKQNLKTFTSIAKSVTITTTTKQVKQIKAERNVLGQVAVLATRHNLNMEKVLSHPLGPVPWSLATADGALVKTNKAKLLHALETEQVLARRPEIEYMNCIIDGNAVLQAQVALPTTFGELAEKVFDQLPKVSRVDFVTDTYLPHSIKNPERRRRGASTTLLLKGSLTKIPRNWKRFMTDTKNKEQLIHFLLGEWKQDRYAIKLKNRVIYFVSGQNCTVITSTDGSRTDTYEVEALKSSQEEADSRIILHLHHMASQISEDFTIVIRSPDTDVFILLLKFAQTIKQTILFDTGVGDKRRLIEVQKVIDETGQEICEVLPSFHAFSGCDGVSAFVRKGKLLPWKLLQKNPEFISTFKSLGSSLSVDEDTYIQLEKFTCLLYNQSSIQSSIDKLRYNHFLQRYSPRSAILSNCDGIDMSLLPPCRMSLREHIKRANYQAFIWNRADQAKPDVPSPDGHGWCVIEGRLDFVWCSGPMMPQELIDVLGDHVEEGEMDEPYEVDESEEINNITDLMYEYDD